jgi:hypothetical protein
MTQPAPPAGWYPDPSGTPGPRYWDGARWTQVPPPPPAPLQQPTVVVNNNIVAGGYTPPVYVATGPNHALHAVLTLFTCGAWLPIWIIVAIVDASQPRGQQSYPPAVVYNGGKPTMAGGQQSYPPSVVYNGGKPTMAGNIILAIILAVISALVLVGICSSNPIMLIPFGVLAVGGFFGYRYWRREQDRRAEQAKIAARADAEHRASLKGDPAGTYGQYPPPPLPEPDQWPPPNIPPGA